MRKIIIDGYNLIYAHPELKEKVQTQARTARQVLIHILAEYMRTRRAKAILVFDSRLSRSTAHPSLTPRLEVVFSKSGITADEVIVKMMESEPDPQTVAVVSSDYKDIGRVAKSLGVELVSAEAFWREVLREKKRGQKRQEKPGLVSKREIEYWLDRFESEANNSEQS